MESLSPTGVLLQPAVKLVGEFLAVGLAEGRRATGDLASIAHFFHEVAHGQALFWGRHSEGMQGVTELDECERCDDAWLQEVQHEFRMGQLAEDTHAFLHGLPTTVPGSWVGGDVACKNARCRKLAGAAECGKRTRSSHIQDKECEICKQDRRSKVLVSNGYEDKSFKSEGFLCAPAVFANNDLKYESNTLRAKLYVDKHCEAVTYCTPRIKQRLTR